MPRIILALLLLGSSSAPLAAQQLPQSLDGLSYAPARETAAAPRLIVDLRDSTASRTYWLEGALVGGVPFALLGASLAGWGCSSGDNVDSDPCWDNELLGAAFGFGVGGTLGALIGGQIKKKEQTDSLPPR